MEVLVSERLTARVFIPASSVVGPAGSWAGPRPAAGVKLDRDAVLMALAGWSSARIARAYGVTQSAAWRYLARRRQGCKGYRPIWRWGQCSGCSAWGWFRLTPARRGPGVGLTRQGSAPDAGRWWCSVSCYRARGTDPAAAYLAARKPRWKRGPRRGRFKPGPTRQDGSGATNGRAAVG